MSILDNPTPATPPTLTLKQKQARYRSQVLAKARSTFSALGAVYADQLAAFWANSDGLTPQECVDAFSKAEAGEFLTRANALKEFLNAQKAGSAADAPGTIVQNQDGSFTAVKS